MNPLKALFVSHEGVGLDRLGYMSLVFGNLIGFSWLKRGFEFEWPFLALPLGGAIVFAAVSYGMIRGIRGKPCGPSFKSWIIARQMVLTTLIAVLVLCALAFVFGELPKPSGGNKGVYLLGAELALCTIVSFVLCRYAFILGVRRGYAVFLSKEKRNQ
ncbi:hypothetical protein [Ruegeria jejuensis]|uniref:hypothetical protein n=1 Tax=Ruegeria jejuensis TaxID=3233338 RepID=UPI00355AD022